MTGPLRLGVLGAADIARRRVLPAMQRVADVLIVAVGSRDLERARDLARTVGPTVRAEHGYQAVLAADDVDAVYIPLPTGLHHEWVSRALDAGKHVLVEKPMTETAADSADVLARARDRGLLLRENFMFLHHAQHAGVRDLVTGGAIGEVVSISASFCIPALPAADVRYRPELGGGALLDVGVYPLRLAGLWSDGGDVEVRGASLEDGPTGVDRRGAALLRTPAGVVVQVAFGFDQHYVNRYEVRGTCGRIVVDRAFTPPETLRPDVRVETPDGVTRADLAPDDQFANLAAAFARDVLTGADPDDPLACGGINRADAVVAQAALVDAVRSTARRKVL